MSEETIPESTNEPEARGQEDPGYIRIRRSHLYLALIPIAFGIGITFGYLLWGREDAAPAETEANPSQLARVEVEQGDDPALGPADAPITIVEFSDFSCPFCRQWHQEVSQELFDAYPGQIRFVYKDFPIVQGGRAGFLAAQAAHCAGEQGAYWEYHDALFSGDYALDSPGVSQITEDLGLDLERFKECMTEARYADEVRDDFEYGVSLGVSSTPTFFINGTPLVGAQPLARFMDVIDAALDD
jgi:protein-disulfide isomerase